MPSLDVNLVLIERDELLAAPVRLAGIRAAHLRDVLRVVPGSTVRIGIVDGPLGIATVINVGTDTVEISCELEATIPPRPRVDVLLAVPRPKVLRRLWAQFAALGVGQIILTNAARVERNYFDTHVLEPSFVRALLIEGLQQARDTRLPLISVHRRLTVLIEDELDGLFPGGVRVVADPRADRSLRSTLPNDDARVLMAIGPEGGWNDFELRLLERHGFTAAAMGPRTLRTDTACVALLAIVHEALRR